MKIKNYLALLVIGCLITGYIVSYLISASRERVEFEHELYVNFKLWTKDVEGIESDVKQYLLLGDLILGSNQTYLISSTQSKGEQIIDELLALAENQHFDDHGKINIQPILNQVTAINHILVAFKSITEPEVTSHEFLDQFDRFSENLVEKFEQIQDLLEEAAIKEAQRMEAAERFHSIFEKGILFFYSALILGLWVWSYRTISKPIQLLDDNVNEYDRSGRFIGVSDAPLEISNLSKNFVGLVQSLSFQATHDPLTGLSNRRVLRDGMHSFVADSKASGREHALCFIDLDHFKLVNDSCGHGAGDALLRQVSEILNSSINSNDVLARLGGDEFAILFFDCTLELAEKRCTQLRQKIRDIRFESRGMIFHISASIGINKIAYDSEIEIEDLLNAADIACKRAKELGKDVVQVYDSHKDILRERREETLSVNEIKRALEAKEIEIFYQTIECLDQSNTACHFEILVRLRNSAGEIISPAGFLPLIERYRFGQRLDQLVIEKTLDWLIEHRQDLPEVSMCSINLSGQSVANPEVREFILTKLDESGFPPEKLCFEITETAAVGDWNYALELITILKNRGCHFALDDFGSGLSSFGYLRNLQVDYIKIDGIFVKDMLEEPSSYAIVKAIAMVAKALGKKVVAEYVENQEIAEALKRIGISYAQGYHFSRPQPVERLLDKAPVSKLKQL